MAEPLSRPIREVLDRPLDPESKAWKILSSALSWAVEDDGWPVSSNGCLTMQRRRGMRNQEVWALSLGDLPAGRRPVVREVLSYGQLDAGKTEGATGPKRRPPIDKLLATT